MKKKAHSVKKKSMRYSVGFDKNGKKYIYHGEVKKPDFPILAKMPLTDSEKLYLVKLKEIFPILDENNPKPLAMNFQMKMKERMRSSPSIDLPFKGQIVYKILRNYCNTIEYKISVIKNPFRFDLDGNTHEPIRKECKFDALQAIKFHEQEKNFWKSLPKKSTSQKPKFGVLKLSTKKVDKPVNNPKFSSPKRAG